MVVVDKEGRAVYCNRAFQRFAAKGFLTGKTGAASKVTQWPKIASQLSSVRENSSQVANCTPEVQAWLDSSSTTLEQDCRVYAQRLSVAGDDLTAFSITDTSQEDRIRLLERAFLHDLVNAAGSIQMLIDLLTGGTSRRERDEYIKLLQVSTNRLLSEIYHEKMMLDSTGSIPSGFDAHEILTTLADYYRKQPFARNCRIEIDKGAVESAKLLGDQTLLVRVLDNMLRNAVEAASNGGVITLGYRRVESEVEFWIHNPHTISENVRTKIFHPSFTMNERDRDGETQETKLLSELCGGTVSVSSDKEIGTTYSVRYPMAGDAVSTHRRFHTKHAS
jgi:signal transduction histidine kinase